MRKIYILLENILLLFFIFSFASCQPDVKGGRKISEVSFGGNGDSSTVDSNSTLEFELPAKASISVEKALASYRSDVGINFATLYLTRGKSGENCGTWIRDNGIEVGQFKTHLVKKAHGDYSHYCLYTKESSKANECNFKKITDDVEQDLIPVAQCKRGSETYELWGFVGNFDDYDFSQAGNTGLLEDIASWRKSCVGENLLYANCSYSSTHEKGYLKARATLDSFLTRWGITKYLDDILIEELSMHLYVGEGYSGLFTSGTKVGLAEHLVLKNLYILKINEWFQELRGRPPFEHEVDVAVSYIVTGSSPDRVTSYVRTRQNPISSLCSEDVIEPCGDGEGGFGLKVVACVTGAYQYGECNITRCEGNFKLNGTSCVPSVTMCVPEEFRHSHQGGECTKIKKCINGVIESDESSLLKKCDNLVCPAGSTKVFSEQYGYRCGTQSDVLCQVGVLCPALNDMAVCGHPAGDKCLYYGKAYDITGSGNDLKWKCRPSKIENTSSIACGVMDSEKTPISRGQVSISLSSTTLAVGQKPIINWVISGVDTCELYANGNRIPEVGTINGSGSYSNFLPSSGSSTIFKIRCSEKHPYQEISETMLNGLLNTVTLNKVAVYLVEAQTSAVVVGSDDGGQTGNEKANVNLDIEDNSSKGGVDLLPIFTNVSGACSLVGYYSFQGILRPIFNLNNALSNTRYFMKYTDAESSGGKFNFLGKLSCSGAAAVEKQILVVDPNYNLTPPFTATVTNMTASAGKVQYTFNYKNAPADFGCQVFFDYDVSDPDNFRPSPTGRISVPQGSGSRFDISIFESTKISTSFSGKYQIRCEKGINQQNGAIVASGNFMHSVILSFDRPAAEQVVQEVYLRDLGRNADMEGISAWVPIILEKYSTKDEAREQFSNTMKIQPEYLAMEIYKNITGREKSDLVSNALRIEYTEDVIDQRSGELKEKLVNAYHSASILLTQQKMIPGNGELQFLFNTTANDASGLACKICAVDAGGYPSCTTGTFKTSSSTQKLVLDSYTGGEVKVQLQCQFSGGSFFDVTGQSFSYSAIVDNSGNVNANRNIVVKEMYNSVLGRSIFAADGSYWFDKMSDLAENSEGDIELMNACVQLVKDMILGAPVGSSDDARLMNIENRQVIGSAIHQAMFGEPIDYAEYMYSNILYTLSEKEKHAEYVQIMFNLSGLGGPKRGVFKQRCLTNF